MPAPQGRIRVEADTALDGRQAPPARDGRSRPESAGRGWKNESFRSKSFQIVRGDQLIEQPCWQDAGHVARQISWSDRRVASKSEFRWGRETLHARWKIAIAEHYKRLYEFPRLLIPGPKGREPAEPVECLFRQAPVDQTVVDPGDDIAGDDLTGGALQHPVDDLIGVHPLGLVDELVFAVDSPRPVARQLVLNGLGLPESG